LDATNACDVSANRNNGGKTPSLRSRFIKTPQSLKKSLVGGLVKKSSKYSLRKHEQQKGEDQQQQQHQRRAKTFKI